MELDWSDILGQDTMPIAQDTNFHVARDSNSSSSLFSLKKLVFVLVALFLGYSAGIRLWRRFLLWRERSYKLATRRRHGIPDDDLRPFNVAYTDAVMRAREEELRKQAKSRPPVQHLPVQAASVTQAEAVPANNLRQRPVSDTAIRSTTAVLPGGYTSRSTESMLPPAPRSGLDHLPNGYPSTTHVQQPIVPSVNRRPDRPSIYSERHDGKSDNEVKKRSRHMEQDEEHEAKKTRVEGEELIDGDEDAEFEEGAPRRGSKRGIQEEADEDSDQATETKHSRGKRARKVSGEKAPQGRQADQNMDIDDEDMDDITELKPISRGRKRDRAEAGSTFGGDDDDESALENEVDGDSKLRRRRRKRRTVAKRKSEATYLRGKKREREGEDEDASDDNSDETSPSKVSSSRRKRGKRSSNVQRHEIERQKSDVSMDESVTSSKRVREIGEEWESNGVRYKIGPNGQRLRQALVKKARQKFVMPKDSQHPDRNANMQVCIECWLTEEEYQRVKADHMLAWQDSPKRSEDAEKLSLDTTSQSVPFPASIPGKNLLWSASTSTTPTMSPASYSPAESQYEIPLPRRGSSYRHSIATSVGLPMTPFGSSTSTLTAVKRISSTSRALSLTGSTNTHLASSINGSDSPGTPCLSDSTNGSPRTPATAKVFSKWEKQELEARAIMKVREANRKKEMEKEAKEKEKEAREAREAKERIERERAAEKARLEKERQEKERQERERLEKEKVEREKEAVAAATSTAPGSIPSITVTAPSTGPTPAAAPTPNNFFNLSSSTTKSAETTASTGQSSAVPNFFAKPAEPVKPASTGFSFGAPPATTPTAVATPATNQLPFSFAAPSGAASEQKKDPFGNAAAGSASTQPPVQAQAQSNPIFSFAKDASTVAGTTAPVSAFPSATPATATTGTTTGTTAGASTGTTGATTTPKFSFNFNKPAATTTATTTPAATPMTTMTPEKKETPTPMFGFKPSTTGASSTGTTTSNATGLSGVSAATAPKFTFGTTFGTANTGASTTAATKDTTTTTKTGFGASGPTIAGTSAFGNTGTSFGTGTSSSTTTSAFGIKPSLTAPAFGTTGSAFGAATSAFGKPSAMASPFGTTTATSSTTDSSTPLNPFSTTTTSNATKTENKTSFNFNNPASSASSGSSTSGNTTFSFGATPSTSSTTTSTTPGVFSFKASTTTPQSSPFGTAASTGTSMFGKPGGESSNTTTTPTAPTASGFTFSMSGSQK